MLQSFYLFKEKLDFFLQLLMLLKQKAKPLSHPFYHGTCTVLAGNVPMPFAASLQAETY